MYKEKYRKEKGLESKDFLAQLDIAHKVLNKYYQTIDMSPIYAVALILNPKRCTRYIQANWKSEWRKPALNSVQKL